MRGSMGLSMDGGCPGEAASGDRDRDGEIYERRDVRRDEGRERRKRAQKAQKGRRGRRGDGGRDLPINGENPETETERLCYTT